MIVAGTITSRRGNGPHTAGGVCHKQRRRRAHDVVLGALAGLAALILVPGLAHATCPTFHTLTNGTSADATQVMDNFNNILGCPNFTGNVGIGTASPADKLTLYNGRFRMATDTSGGSLIITEYGGWARITAAASTGGGGVAIGREPVTVHGQPSGNYSVELWSGSNGNTQTLVAASGRIGIGTPSPAYPLHVIGQAAATSFVTTSDARLKKNVASAPYGLETIAALRPVSFEWDAQKWQAQKFGTQNNPPPAGRKIGLLAQEVEAVVPEAVSTAVYKLPKKDPKEADDILEIKGVDYGELVPIAIKAIQELKAENDAQAAEIEVLKRRLAALEQK